MFLYSTVSTLNPKQDLLLCIYYKLKLIIPIVGIVVTISPSFNLYKMVVFPAASKPTIKIRISFFPNKDLNKLAKRFPISEQITVRFAQN